MAKEPVQKGSIQMENTSKNMLWREKQFDAYKETMERHDGQTLKYHETGSESYRSKPTNSWENL